MSRALPVLLLTIGCDELLPYGAPMVPYCEDVESSITAHEATDIGLTGAELIDDLPESAAGEVEWSGGRNSELAWGFAADSETLRYVESTATYPASEDPSAPMIDIAVECLNYIAIDGTLTLHSSDGQLHEAIPVTLSLNERSLDSSLAIHFFTHIDALSGSLELSEYVDESRYDTVSVYLEGTITEGTLTGELAAQGEGATQDNVFAEYIPIAAFSAGE